MKVLRKFIPTICFILSAALFSYRPKVFCVAFLQGLGVWANNVLPVLLPFCLLAPLACRSLPQKGKITKFLFGQNNDGVFLASLICGYPVGAKLISQFPPDEKQAIAISAYCSTPGPVFLLASVCPLLNNVVASAILVFTQFAACIASGLIFRTNTTNDNNAGTTVPEKNFSETLVDSVLSVLNVGALIGIAYMLSAAIKMLLPYSVSDSLYVAFLCGIIEMTGGIFFVTSATSSILSATVLCSALLGFGGIGIALQSMSFLSKQKVRALDYLKTKLVQGSLCAIISFLLCKFFL